jgi:hypothetical protein
MLLHEPKMRAVQKALIALFAVMFAFAAVTQSASPTAAPHCKCCVTETPDATPCPASCCEAPVREEAPVAPTPAPSSRGIDWQGLAVLIPYSITLDGTAPATLPTPSVSSLPLRSVPIFQRDCSYLI